MGYTFINICLVSICLIAVFGLVYRVYLDGKDDGIEEGLLQSLTGEIKIVDNLVMIYTNQDGKSVTYKLNDKNIELLNKKKTK